MNAAGETEIKGPNLGQLRWHCRRGLLELDLIFTRFLETHFDSLDGDSLKALQELLAYEDTDLWPMISGRKECEKPQLRRLIELLRSMRRSADE